MGSIYVWSYRSYADSGVVSRSSIGIDSSSRLIRGIAGLLVNSSSRLIRGITGPPVDSSSHLCVDQVFRVQVPIFLRAKPGAHNLLEI